MRLRSCLAWDVCDHASEEARREWGERIRAVHVAIIVTGAGDFNG
jgi:hypothetical protein